MSSYACAPIEASVAMIAHLKAGKIRAKKGKIKVTARKGVLHVDNPVSLLHVWRLYGVTIPAAILHFFVPAGEHSVLIPHLPCDYYTSKSLYNEDLRHYLLS